MHERMTEKRGSLSRQLVLLLLALVFLLCPFPVMAQEAAGETERETVSETEYPEGWEIRYITRNLCYTGSDEQVTIPASITKLDMFAFYGNTAVKAIIVPASVKSIESYSLYNIPNLRYIIFQGNPVMDRYAIWNCPRLANISVGRNNTYAQTCAQENDIPVKTGAGTGFQKSKVYLLKGDSCRQVLCNSLADVTAWKSSRKSVATVTSGGKVKARKPGKAVITAYTKNGAWRYTVQVYKKTVSARITQIRKDEKINGKTAYQKVKAVHNWMIRNIRYDYKNFVKGRIPLRDGTVKGALLNRLCVCQGYAVAFRKLMKAYKIPCKYVRGTAGGVSHAWNMVKLGGKWYHIDVTWDDPILEGGKNTNTRIFYTYFLKSTAYMLANDHRFKVSAYPKCKSRKYDKTVAY